MKSLHNFPSRHEQLQSHFVLHKVEVVFHAVLFLCCSILVFVPALANCQVFPLFFLLSLYVEKKKAFQTVFFIFFIFLGQLL